MALRIPVMTPHINPGRYENRAAPSEAFKDFRLALRKARVPLHIAWRPNTAVARHRRAAEPERGAVPGRTGRYRIILLEFRTPKSLPVRISSSSGCCSTTSGR